jgi:hypothetical protein
MAERRFYASFNFYLPTINMKKLHKYCANMRAQKYRDEKNFKKMKSRTEREEIEESLLCREG